MPPAAMASRVRVAICRGRPAFGRPGVDRGRGTGPGPPEWAGGTWARRRTHPTRDRTGRPAPSAAASSRRGGAVPAPSRRSRRQAPARPGSGSPTAERMASASSSAWASTSGRRWLPHIGEGGEHGPERGRAGPVGGWEVGAAEERAAVGGEKDAHGPAPGPGDGLDGLHVDGVDVGPLLTVHLDGDERGVELARRWRGPRTTRGPSRGTSGRPSSRRRGRWACPRAGLVRTPRRPTDTSRPDCRRAGAGRETSRGPVGSGSRGQRSDWPTGRPRRPTVPAPGGALKPGIRYVDGILPGPLSTRQDSGPGSF